MKFVAIYRYWMDCPSCDGTGDINIKRFSKMEDVLAFIKDHVDQVEVEHVFDESDEECLDITVKTSFHRIHFVEIKELKNEKRTWKILKPHLEWELHQEIV